MNCISRAVACKIIQPPAIHVTAKRIKPTATLTCYSSPMQCDYATSVACSITSDPLKQKFPKMEKHFEQGWVKETDKMGPCAWFRETRDAQIPTRNRIWLSRLDDLSSVLIGACGIREMLLFRHSAKSLNAQEERLVTSS